MREKRVEETASLAAHKASRQTRLAGWQAGRQGINFYDALCVPSAVQDCTMTPSVQLSSCPFIHQSEAMPTPSVIKL